MYISLDISYIYWGDSYNRMEGELWASRRGIRAVSDPSSEDLKGDSKCHWLRLSLNYGVFSIFCCQLSIFTTVMQHAVNSQNKCSYFAMPLLMDIIVALIFFSCKQYCHKHLGSYLLWTWINFLPRVNTEWGDHSVITYENLKF